VDDDKLMGAAKYGTALEGIDLSPEGGASIAAAVQLKSRGLLRSDDAVVLYNTGAGWLYRTPEDVLGS
jgi:threonine synthase